MIEVEVKFPLDNDQEQKVTDGAELIGEKVIHDIYYDHADFRLTLKDWWLRQRDGKLELKKSPGPADYNRGRLSRRYLELDSEQDILQALNISGHPLAAALTTHNITPFARIGTRRLSYKKGEYRIDIDHADAGYSLGELELLIEKESEIAAADKKLLDYLSSKGIQPAATQRGKVAHFLETKAPDHFNLLVKAGVIDP